VVPTNANFTVAAWVRLPAIPTTTQTVISEVGSHGGAFALQYRADLKHWAFTMTSADGDTPVNVTADSGVAPVVGNWALLTGVYDMAAGKTQIYVSGTPGPTAAVPSAWNAGGPLLLGRTQTAGVASEFSRGDVDDVRIWDRAVYKDEIVRLVNGSSAQGEWLFDEGSGTTSIDTSGLDQQVASLLRRDMDNGTQRGERDCPCENGAGGYARPRARYFVRIRALPWPHGSGSMRQATGRLS